MTAVAASAQTVRLPQFEEIREAYLEVRVVGSHEVVTAIELLSPTNKSAVEGRREYEAKRSQVLHTRTNLVEIDLLRAGEPMEMEPSPERDYRIMVARGWERPYAWIIAFDLHEPVPAVTIPLRQSDAGARLALKEILDAIFDRARYDLRLDYGLPPPPPALSREEAAWVDELLRARGLRS